MFCKSLIVNMKLNYSMCKYPDLVYVKIVKTQQNKYNNKERIK